MQDLKVPTRGSPAHIAWAPPHTIWALVAVLSRGVELHSTLELPTVGGILITPWLGAFTLGLTLVDERIVSVHRLVSGQVPILFVPMHQTIVSMTHPF